MRIEAAARLNSTLSNLPALELSRNISFGAPPPIFNFVNRSGLQLRLALHRRILQAVEEGLAVPQLVVEDLRTKGAPRDLLLVHLAKRSCARSTHKNAGCI